MKRAAGPTLLIALLACCAGAAAATPVSVTVRTRNWQGYSFETAVSEDGRLTKKFRKEGGPDLSEAPVVDEITLSASNLEHLSKVVEHSGLLALPDDVSLEDVNTGARATKTRLEGQVTVRLGAAAKTVRFGPNVESIPEPVWRVLNEVSRLAQDRR